MVKTIMKMDKVMLVLLIGVLLTHVGTYMVIPILPIMLAEDVELNLGTVGLVLAIYSISFQTGSLSGGFLADRIGRRTVIGLGAIIASAGFIGLGIMTSYIPILFTTAGAGLGNGLNAPSTKAAIAAIASDKNQTTAFSYRGVAANIGTATAGLAVFFFVSGSPSIIFWIAGAIYIGVALKSWLLLPKKCGDAPCPVIPKGAYREVFKNKPFVAFGFVSIFVWALYAQLAFVLPIRATDILDQPSNVALIWTIKSLMVILLQSWITKSIIGRLHPFVALSVGIFIIGIGIGSLFWMSSFLGLVISGTIFVFGEMLILPTMDSTISQLSQAGLLGLFFGLANVLSGFGEATGNFVGGRLLESGESTSVLLWMVYIIAGGVISGIILLLKGWRPMQSSLQKAADQEDKPERAPRVNPGPSNHLSFPFHKWEEEAFFRKKRTT